MFYFIYKQIQITNIGGISIPNIEGINGGQGSYKEWLLGTTDDTKKLLLIKEFNPRIVPESVWRGFSLIGKTQIEDNSNPISPVLRDLTAEEILQQKAATNWEFKEDARMDIEINVGDHLKQIANIDQQIQLITPVVVRMYKTVLAICASINFTISEEILPATTKVQYDNFTDLYLYKIAMGELIDRIDVDPDPGQLIYDMLDNINTIGNSVKVKYLDKKV